MHEIVLRYLTLTYSINFDENSILMNSKEIFYNNLIKAISDVFTVSSSDSKLYVDEWLMKSGIDIFQYQSRDQWTCMMKSLTDAVDNLAKSIDFDAIEKLNIQLSSITPATSIMVSDYIMPAMPLNPPDHFIYLDSG